MPKYWFRRLSRAMRGFVVGDDTTESPATNDDAIVQGNLTVHGSITAGGAPVGAGGSNKNACYASVLRTTLPAYIRVGNVCTAVAVGAFPAIDGQALVVGTGFRSRFLVWDVAAHVDLGIWTLTDAGGAGSPWIATRATDMDSDADVANGAIVPVVFGATEPNSIWGLATAPTITLNTTALFFVTPLLAEDGGITGPMIGAGEVGTLQLADNGVTQAKIPSGVLASGGGLVGGSGTQFQRDRYLFKEPSVPGVGAVWTTVFTVTIPADAEATVIAAFAASAVVGVATESVAFAVLAQFIRSGGVLTQQGAVGGVVYVQNKSTGAAAADARIIISGTTIVVQGLGVAGGTFTWGGEIHLLNAPPASLGTVIA